MTENGCNISGRVTPPVAAKVKASEAEFTDADGLRTLFGLKRSMAYVLLAEGKIRGISLRRKGNSRGKRLFHVASVRAFLNRQLEEEKEVLAATEQEPAAA
jgi:hypothetical protein